MADQNQRYSRRRSALSPDYAEGGREEPHHGVSHSDLPRSGSRKAAIAVGVLAAVVVALLVSRMPFLAGSLNAGAPVDEMVTGSVENGPADEPVLMTDGVRPGDEIGEDDDASSAMPTANRLTPSTAPGQ